MEGVQIKVLRNILTRLSCICPYLKIDLSIVSKNVFVQIGKCISQVISEQKVFKCRVKKRA